jgi:hypothetical protein
LHGVRPPDRPDAGLGEPEVPDRALLDQLLHRSGHVLDWHVGVDAVLVEQVDAVGPEPPERVLDGAPDRLGPAVEALRPAAGLDTFEIPAELRRDHDLVANGLERLTDELLVRERTVHLRGVEEPDAAIDRGADHRDHLLRVTRRAVAEAHRHAAEAELRDLEVAVSKGAGLHRSPRQRGASLSVAARASGLVMRSTMRRA